MMKVVTDGREATTDRVNWTNRAREASSAGVELDPAL